MTPARGRVLAVALVAAGVAAGLGVAACAGASPEVRDASLADRTGARPAYLPPPDLGAARELFALHCAVCHGRRGRGDAAGGVVLFPPARDFGGARFRLVSTASRAPTDRDLAWVIQRGVPGSAMPSFGWLPEERVWDLATHVRELAVEGLAEDLERRARSAGLRLAPREAEARALARLEPGPVVDPGEPLTVVDGEALALGERLWRERCVECHGTQGQGTPEPRPTEEGELDWPRDFTAGWLKGGATYADLAWRIRLGLPGTAMAGNDLEARELAALVAWVQRLIPAGAHRRLVQQRRTSLARRVAAVPSHPDAAAWARADEIHVALAPLVWDDEAVLGASLSALHDGREIAIRVRWRDATRDDHVLGEVELADGCALQLSTAEAPPLFGMGSRSEPTNLWHWKAFTFEQTAGVLDLVEAAPHVLRDLVTGDLSPADVPLILRVPGISAPATEGVSVEARGSQSAPHFAAGAAELAVTPAWEGGVWSVVFRRSLPARSDREVPLLPASRVQVACAVWNASAGDLRARKSISIWHELLLAE